MQQFGVIYVKYNSHNFLTMSDNQVSHQNKNHPPNRKVHILETHMQIMEEHQTIIKLLLEIGKPRRAPQGN